MNTDWPEHLRMLHRLTRRNCFGFGRFCVTYDWEKDQFIHWSYMEPGLRATDEELVSIIAGYGAVELVSVS